MIVLKRVLFAMVAGSHGAHSYLLVDYYHRIGIHAYYIVSCQHLRWKRARNLIAYKLRTFFC